MTKDAEDWQAIAYLVAGEINDLVRELQIFVACIMAAVNQNNYQAFRTELDNLERWSHARPKHTSD